MPRFKGIPGYLNNKGKWVKQKTVPYTAEEEAAADAAEAEWLAGAPLREIDVRLVELDYRLPRALEDAIAKGAYLYPIKKEKEALRVERASLIEAASG